ncbi:Incenp-like protein ICP-1 [Aphelenchoides fujianensis]|nr:Incenp-like protein ICP-1 [Aphelenchoides fujianensis]
MPPRRNPKKAKDANARDAPPSIIDVWGKFFTIPPVEVFQEPVNEWALDTLQQIREYRDELKDQLEECVAKKMKKDAQEARLQDARHPEADRAADRFRGRRGSGDRTAASRSSRSHSARGAHASGRRHAAVPRRARCARTPPVVANKTVDETMRPFHTSKRVIPATPSPRHLQASSPAVNRPPLAAPSMGTSLHADRPPDPHARNGKFQSSSLLPISPLAFSLAGRTFTTKPREAKSPARNVDRLEAKRKEEEERRLMLEEAQRKQQEAERRRQEYLQHEKERHARENNQRKQRVVLRNKAKQQQDEQQREEKKRQEDRIRKFHEAQRTPNKQTPTKLLQVAHPPVTPRQKAIPTKRSKPSHDEPMPEVEHQHVDEEQEEPVEEMQVEEFNPPSSIHPPSPPAAGPSHEPPAVEIEVEVEVEVVQTRPKEATPNETAAKQPPAESVVLEESPFDEEDEKENAQAAVPETPVAAPRNKPNESVYGMTPDKIYLPSTEHDYNNPRKRVPKWAEKNHLGPHVRDLLRRIDDPSLYFGQIKPPKMDLLFPATVQKYQELPNETTVWDSPISQPRRAPLKK